MMHVGPLMILLSWLAGWWLLTKWRNKDFLSISRHAASAPMTMVLFAVVLIGCGSVLYGWMAFWLAPRLGLGRAFMTVLLVAFICQAVTALLPDIEGWRRVGHKLAAWSMAVLFLPMAILLSTAANLSLTARLICAVLTMYMVVGVSLVMLRKVKTTFLFFQASYVMALECIVLAATYL
jgi:hypothetical protein